MCAINPVHQHHFKLSVYTADSKVSVSDFNDAIYGLACELELRLNSTTPFRWHIHDFLSVNERQTDALAVSNATLRDKGPI